MYKSKNVYVYVCVYVYVYITIIITPILWVKQCHELLMTEHCNHTTCKHADDWGMVPMALFYLHQLGHSGTLWDILRITNLDFNGFLANFTGHPGCFHPVSATGTLPRLLPFSFFVCHFSSSSPGLFSGKRMVSSSSSARGQALPYLVMPQLFVGLLF